MANLLFALTRLETFEATMAGFYEKLSAHFEGDEGASRLFARLAAEEKTHQTQVQYISRVARKNAQLLDAIQIDLAAVDRDTEIVGRILGQLGKISLAEVVRYSIHLESGTAEFGWRGSVASADAGLAQMIRGLEEACRRHAQHLTAFAAERKIPTESVAAPR